jgi:hypothetical protein
MKRGLGSDQAHEHDDNFNEQVKFKEDRKKRAFQKPVRVEPTSKEDEYAPRGKKSVVLKSRTEKLQPVKAENSETVTTPSEKTAETPAPVEKQMLINGITLTGMNRAVGIMGDSLKTVRSLLDQKNASLVTGGNPNKVGVMALIVADNLSNFYYRGIETIDDACTATRHDTCEILEAERAKVREMKEVTHKMIVDKFDEAKRVLDTKKDTEKSFDLIVEATVMCERDLAGHQHNLFFEPLFTPKIDKE